MVQTRHSPLLVLDSTTRSPRHGLLPLSHAHVNWGQHLHTPLSRVVVRIRQVSKANASSGPFVSKTERFKLNSKAIAEQAPGPGNYDVNQQWISQQVLMELEASCFGPVLRLSLFFAVQRRAAAKAPAASRMVREPSHHTAVERGA